MIQIVKTNTESADFSNLIKRLDQELLEINGEEHQFFSQYNGIAEIKHVVVAYDLGTAVACGAMKEFDAMTMEVKRMYTSPAVRGKHIAALILDALENWAVELGYRKCILETGTRLPSAIKLYTRQRYEQIANYGQYVNSANSICFEKYLCKQQNMNKKLVLNETEIEKIRCETKGTRSMVHFNNAGASLPPDVVVNSVIDYLQEEALGGGYEVEAVWKENIEKTYHLVANLINADPSEIAITENASLAWGIAFNGIHFDEGDEIITSELEYITNMLGFLQAQKRKRLQVKVIPIDQGGDIQLDDLENAITKRTRLIAITHIASSNGAIAPVEEIGEIARKYGVLYLVDACQSVGHMPVDVKRIKCDMLSVTGRCRFETKWNCYFQYTRSRQCDYQAKVE